MGFRGYRGSTWLAVAGVLLSLLPGSFCACVLAAEDDGDLETALGRATDGGLLWPPYFQGNLIIDVFSDHTFSADNPNDETSFSFAEIRAEANIYFSPNAVLETAFAVKPAEFPESGEDVFFGNHALIVDTLALTFGRSDFWVSGGRGSVNFGIGASSVPGIWGADIPGEAYKLNDLLGIGASKTFQTESAGSHAVYLATWMLDTSVLSKSWITSTGRNTLEMGGPGNTEGLNSFGIAVDGSGIGSLPNFRYHVALAMQATDRVNDEFGDPLPMNLIADERRLAVAGEWSGLPLGEFVTVTSLIEYVRLWNARGIRNDSEEFMTASLGFFAGQWNATTAVTAWKVDPDDDSEVNNAQLEISAGYLFENGIGLSVGYRFQDIGEESSHTFGMWFSYVLPYSL